MIGALVLFIVYLAVNVFRAPNDFPRNTPVTIDQGLSAGAVADLLEEKNVVRSSELLYLAVLLFHDPESIKAGSFVFHDPQSVFAVARRITDDGPDMDYIVLTFFEGLSVEKYASIAESKLMEFDADHFFKNALIYEGFLFPETYYVPHAYTADELIALLNKTYLEQTKTAFADAATPLDEYEVVILASILEREGNDPENMRMIAGIIMNRLELDMPLQLDATMEYVLDKPLDELTPEDLAIDSPYNTYLYKGLPPTPIGNPGLEAIEAALHPTETDDLYYITGNDGNFYYAETFEEHRANIQTYLQ